jgi:hypothetical protein
LKLISREKGRAKKAPGSKKKQKTSSSTIPAIDSSQPPNEEVQE